MLTHGHVVCRVNQIGRPPTKRLHPPLVVSEPGLVRLNPRLFFDARRSAQRTRTHLSAHRHQAAHEEDTVCIYLVYIYIYIYI